MAVYENLKLDKSLYNCRGGFSQALERLDPSANYVGTALGELDAFQRQLKRFDIKVTGPQSDLVEKFYQTSDSAALFPEYVARAVRQGITEANHIPEIVATVTKIDGMDYRTIASIPENRAMPVVEEGGEILQTTIKTQENLVTLHKRGRMLVASYEALRFQRLDLFTVTLRQIGAYIARTQLEDAISVIISGDGNENPASVIYTETENTLTYGDLLKLWGEFDPHEMNTMLVSPAVMQKILAMNEMKDPQNGFQFLTSGKMITPFGANIIRSSAVPDDKIIALDKRFALEMVQAGDLMLDYDRLIDHQLERAAITCITGFAKIFQGASKVLSLSAEPEDEDEDEDEGNGNDNGNEGGNEGGNGVQ